MQPYVREISTPPTLFQRMALLYTLPLSLRLCDQVGLSVILCAASRKNLCMDLHDFFSPKVDLRQVELEPGHQVTGSSGHLAMTR